MSEKQIIKIGVTQWKTPSSLNILQKTTKCHSKLLNESLWRLINPDKGSLACHFNIEKMVA